MYKIFLGSTSFSFPVLLRGVCLALSLLSCAAPPILEEADCVVPPLPCKPSEFNEVLIDTEYVTEGNYLYSIELLPRPVNTDANDHAIIFSNQGSSRFALVTNDSSATGSQQISVFGSPGYIPSVQFGKLGTPVNSVSTGAAWYVTSEKMLYITTKSQTDDPSDYDIYRAALDFADKSFNLRSYEKLPSLHLEGSFDAQATVSPDGKCLYFASERGGGSGGVDIWMSSRSSGSGVWSTPMPVSKVNTLCNELSPSVSYDGKWLYFASNGHRTVGGYDIFRAKLDERGMPGVPVNIGKKVNTEYDELFPCHPSDSLLYYSSDQPASLGKRNLFVLHRKRVDPKLANLYERKNPDREPERIIPGSFSDSSTIRLEGNVVVVGDTGKVNAEVFWRDPQKDEELGRKPTDTSGNYAIELPRGKEYDIGAESKDKFYDVKRVDTRNVQDSILQVPTLVIGDTLILRLNFPFDNYTDPYDFTVDDFGVQTSVKWQTHIGLIARSINKDLKRLRKVILAGHTDSVGSVLYNERLSYNRANFIRKELVKRGIAASLLEIAPRGESQPVMKRENETSEVFDMRSRRVELVKIFK